MERVSETGASTYLPMQEALKIYRYRLDAWIETIPCRRAWQPTPVFLPGESHGQRSWVGYSPKGHTASHTTETI